MAKKSNLENQGQQPQMQVSVNLDNTPILYTDSVSMTTNEHGVVFDVMQRMGPTSQMRIVARFGMSREHAKRFIEELGKLLVVTEGQVQTSRKVYS